MVAWSSLQTWWKDFCCARLQDVLQGPLVAEAFCSGHVLLTLAVTSALLISQLMLQTWPSNFFAFCMLSPLVAALLLAAGAAAAFPAAAASLPALSGVFLAALAVWQTVFGAVFHLLPLGDNRALFTLLNTLLVSVGVYLASRGRVPEMMRKAVMRAVRGQEPGVVDTLPPESEADESVQPDEDGDSTAGRLN